MRSKKPGASILLVACLGLLLLMPWTAAAQTEVSFAVSECIYSWTAKYQRSGNSVLVRIKLLPEAGVSTPLSTLQTRWQNGIRAKWSNKFACAADKPNMMFDVQFVSSNEHHTVTVKAGNGHSDMLNWYETNDGHVAAHEYGHMLGMKDEYPDPHCPTRSPVNTGTVMAGVTGPVVQRYIDAVCRCGPDGSPKAHPMKKIVPKKVRPKDRARPQRITLIVSGGPPGSRLEYVLTANEESKVLSYTYLDELNKGGPAKGNVELSSEALKQLKALVQTGALPGKDLEVIGGPFVPGAIVGAITIEVGDKKQVIRYPVEVLKSGQWGNPSSQALDAVRPAARAAAIREIHRLLVEEAQGGVKKGK